ncbi:probable enoyl-CoA hydratase 2, mitochondrial [Vicia villosa]|uniref:probable enoyl-CoA hydratase 2, mitochondrial n=1 Tax=Vicia villosa TaxID=3911 RepID=UPI00273AA581|nr:probable enoyl-CoA hydratase 2, mitochondrial [Vicia villosa]
MCAFRVLTKLLNTTSYVKTSKPYQHHTLRNLILESPPSQFVKLHRLSDEDSGIIEVRLDRPDAKNAIGKEMLRGLRNVLELINQNSDANVAMIRSSVAGVFCAGADLKERRAMNQSEVKYFVNSLRSTLSFLEEIRVPTIAVIEGVALGGGLEMALACDIRICGANAMMGLPETGLAIIPGAGGTQRLPRLVGKAIAKDIIFTGRKINGIEALSMGLVNYCVAAGEAHSKALEIARVINQKGPVAIRMAKKAINEGVETDLASALVLEEDCYDQVLNTKDRLEGLAAFAEKRKPRYTGE